MIDALTLALTHGLMALAAFWLVTREDLDNDAADADPRPRWRQRRDDQADGGRADAGQGSLAE